MARPLDPRSRAQACRLTGAHEATVRKLERRGALRPVTQWTAIDLVWAKVLTTPGVDPQRTPPPPAVISPGDVLLIPTIGAQVGAIHGSLIQAIGALDAQPDTPQLVLQIGRWHSDLAQDWAC